MYIHNLIYKIDVISFLILIISLWLIAYIEAGTGIFGLFTQIVTFIILTFVYLYVIGGRLNGNNSNN
jgi:hypothetical protein